MQKKDIKAQAPPVAPDVSAPLKAPRHRALQHPAEPPLDRNIQRLAVRQLGHLPLPAPDHVEEVDAFLPNAQVAKVPLPVRVEPFKDVVVEPPAPDWPVL